MHLTSLQLRNAYAINQFAIAQCTCNFSDDGKVDLEEFLTVLIRTGKWKQQPNMEQEAMAAFKAFDVNNDGFISADELRNTMAKLNQPLTKKEAEQMLKAFDKNGDGRICYSGITVTALKMSFSCKLGSARCLTGY